MANPLLSDPLDIKLSDDNKFTFINGDIVLVRGLDGTAQLCRIAIKAFAEEWFLDLDAGVKWWDILHARPDQAIRMAELEIARVLGQVPGVVDIIEIDVKYLDDGARKLEIAWRARTAYGDTPRDTLLLTAQGLTA